MPIPMVHIPISLRAGVDTSLRDMWRGVIANFETANQHLLRPIPVKGVMPRKVPLGWKESPPTVERWDYGESRTYKNIVDRETENILHPYSIAIEWNRFDREDDLLQDLKSSVNESGEELKRLPWLRTTEYFNGVASLNPSLVNCYDGVGLFSQNDGAGVARFGAAGGNIIAGTGLTRAAISNDISRVQRRFLEFKDTTRERLLFTQDLVDYKDFFIIVPSALNRVFQDLADTKIVRTDESSISASENRLVGTFEFAINNALTNIRDYYVVLKHPRWKAFAHRYPNKINIVEATVENSDRARRENIEGSYSDIRTGLNPWAPFIVVKVSNS